VQTALLPGFREWQTIPCMSTRTRAIGQSKLYMWQVMVEMLFSLVQCRYWSDSLLQESIEKDVIRTYPELKFFLEGEGKRQQALQNILFLFAKLNPAIEYVQVQQNMRFMQSYCEIYCVFRE
jgi:hypothetical protein